MSDDASKAATEKRSEPMTVSVDDLPRWHADLPRLTGRLKSTPEDFVVEEIPAYEPAGAGEHLFLWVEKRNLSGEQLLKQVSRALGVATGDIGSAGLKDRRAVTRQWISVPAKVESQIDSLNTEQIQVLRAVRHGNKLRTGHLKGNRFSIFVRTVPSGQETVDGGQPSQEITVPHSDSSVPQDDSGLSSLVNRLSQRGFPNYYGEQRFGHDGETWQLGLDLIAGRKTPRDIPYSRRKFLLRLSLSAVQSELFNRVLAERLRDGLLDTVLAGDVMEVVASGGKFVAEDAAAEQPRCHTYETVITGPMFGPKMKSPTGIPAEREAKILTSAGLTFDQFRNFGDLLSGTRRPLVVRPSDLQMRTEPDGLWFEFVLLPGVYATTLLREVMVEEKGQSDRGAES